MNALSTIKMPVMRSIGVNEFLSTTFKSYPFEGEWLDTFGEPEKNFRAIIYGKSGNGKTEFAIKWAKYMASFTKVYYNSYEQGISKSLQDALKRNNMQEVVGKIIFGNKESFDEMVDRLSKRNSPSCIFVDSRDYINMTADQFKFLVERFKNKSFIILCWEDSGKPLGNHAKAIEYMCDMKIYVREFIARPRSRFGGNKPYIIWNRRREADLFTQPTSQDSVSI
jgi:hypothetical protein